MDTASAERQVAIHRGRIDEQRRAACSVQQTVLRSECDLDTIRKKRHAYQMVPTCCFS